MIAIACSSGCSGNSDVQDDSTTADEALSAPVAASLVGTITVQRQNGGPVETRNVTYVPSGSTPQSYLDEATLHGAGATFAIQSAYQKLGIKHPSGVGFDSHEPHRSAWDSGSVVNADSKGNLLRVNGSVSTWKVYSRFNKFLREETFPKVTFNLTAAQ